MSSAPPTPKPPLYPSPPPGVTAVVLPGPQLKAGTGTGTPAPTKVFWTVKLPGASGVGPIGGPGPQVPPATAGLPPGDKAGAGPGSDITRGLLAKRRRTTTLLT